MDAILTEILTLMTGGLTQIGGAIGTGLTSMVKGIFIEEVTSGGNTTYKLSLFGAVIAIFAGVSLAFSLCRWALNFVTSFGNRNR